MLSREKILLPIDDIVSCRSGMGHRGKLGTSEPIYGLKAILNLIALYEIPSDTPIFEFSESPLPKAFFIM